MVNPQKSSSITIVAAVAPSGAAGYGEDRNRWTLGVSIGAWREPGGAVVIDDLFLTLPGLHKQQLALLMAKLPGLGLARLALNAAPMKRQYDSGLERWEATIEALVTTDVRDAELAAWVEEMRKPVVVADPALGTLVLDRASSCYRADRMVDDQPYRLVVVIEHVPDAARDAAILAALRDRISGIETHVAHYRQAAADELLGVYNESWWEEDLPRLTPEQFMSRLRLKSVYVQPEGGVDVYFDDDDLFAGHVVHVRLDVADRVLEVGLAG
jgi:hypothetical protein